MKLKNYIIPFLLIIILGVFYWRSEDVTNSVVNILYQKPNIAIPNSNQYKKENNYLFVKNTDDFIPYSNQDLLNILYTIINNGWEQFTFYCPTEYIDCLDDLNLIAKDDIILSHINQFVHPFNSFKEIKTITSTDGEITINVTKLYSSTQIYQIEQKMKAIIAENITENMSATEKIKKIHDYIINNTRYDIARSEEGKSDYLSNIAYGPLIEGYAICGGYSDSMALFLSYFNINNFKITSDTHSWNAVYIKDKWLHLDLTWDDPATKNNTNYLLYTYYLIDNITLDTVMTKEHTYDKTVYQELK